MVAGSMDVLDEQVLQGLRKPQFFRSTNWSDDSGIQIMKGIVKEQVAAAGVDNTNFG